MQVTLKMWTPKGTMVELMYDWPRQDMSDEKVYASDLETYWLQAGFTSQRPDHTYPTKEQVIEGVVVVGGTDFNGKPQSVLYLYTDNRALEYSEYRIYPEDEWYPKLASLVNMDDVVSIAPPKSKLMNKGSGYQSVNRKATFVPARNAEGQLIYRKDKEGNRKSWPEYKVQRVEGFAATSTNGNHAATNGNHTATNGTQPVRKGEPTAAWSYADLLAWAEDIGACDNPFEATNSIKKLTRELFDVKPGGESTFLNAATADRHETLKLAYIAHQREKLDERMMHVVVANNLDDMAQDEELPF